MLKTPDHMPEAWRNFASDNVWGAAPEITAALASADMSPVGSYGADPVTQAVTSTFQGVFDTGALEVFPVATGTAANALALATVTPPYGVIYATDVAHIVMDEAGAPEFYAHGARLHTFPSRGGKLDPEILDRHLTTLGGQGVVHHMQPAAVSITQATECGTVYTVAEITAIAEVAHKHGVPLHMDGARFANALAHLGCSAAEMTWQAGVDMLSFGATKNGAWAAEAVLFFDSDYVRDVEFRRKRGGHLLSKMRFVSLQLQAYLEDQVWLRYATHANDMAQRLADGLAHVDYQIFYPVQANEIFVKMPDQVVRALQDKGYVFYPWPIHAHEGGDTDVMRLVTAYATPVAAVEAFLDDCSQVRAQA